MKKLSLLIILIISGFLCSAQLQVKENSFKKVDGFVNINIEKMYDDNDKPYAVLKIKTENINDKQRRELGFGGDAQTFFETEYKDGEVWLYISYYATFLKISHPDLSSTEFWFPYDMEPKRGYELTLVNKPALDEAAIISIIDQRLETSSNVAANPEDFGYIVVKTGSLEGATVYIDGNEMEMKTPFVSDPIKKGPHKIKIVKDGYEAYSDIVAVDGNGMKTVNVDLKKERITNLTRNKGIILTPELNVSFLGDYTIATRAFIPQVNMEYMITPCVGLGIGTGYLYTDTGIGSIPLFGQVSLYLNNKKVSPYLNLKAGYLFSSKEYDHSAISGTDKDSYRFEGMHGSATIGININHSRIGFSIGSYHWEVEYTLGRNYGDRLFYGITYSYLIPF